MALPWDELVQWFVIAAEIEKSRTRSLGIAAANALGRMFRRK